ncbi:unnamed protein product [Medioppia subpectinata]|uniref:SP-RING-type domain-containing protein n=1 Tax=Medioppia subpectinata TaxID=1979941 RepID=A0A7R9KE24_9ACAR|nr:unnamed protein product [Medioppia subpectinata]CAG2101613.1 unnamed protein product [Medioppia subpectinata]
MADMSQIRRYKDDKQHKQKDTYVKKINKMFKTDLIEICILFNVSKNGTKDVLRERLIQLVDSIYSVDEERWSALKSQIKRVYKANDRIKKSPKKVKKKKRKKSQTGDASASSPLRGMPAVFDSDLDNDNSDDSNVSNQQLERIVLKIPKPTQQSCDVNNYYDFFSDYKTNSPANISYNNGLPSAAAANQQSSTSSQPLSAPIPTSDQPIDFSFLFRDLIPTPPTNQSHNPSASGSQFFSHTTAPLAHTFTARAPAPGTQLTAAPNVSLQPYNALTVRPPVAVVRPNVFHPFAPSAPMHYSQPVNYPHFMGHQNYFQNTSAVQNYSHRQYYPNPGAPDLDLPDSQTFDMFLKQQKFLLSQFSSAKQTNEVDGGANDTDDSDHPIGHEFAFKAFQTFTTIKKLLEPTTIGSLSDIGLNIEFTLNLVDFDANNFYPDLQSLLETKSYQIQLRFSYISDVQIKEHKDCVPEFLCIQCNNNRVFDSTEDEERSSGPFDLNKWCVFGVNKVRFWMSKEKYTFLMPCLYEVSIVSFETPDTFLNKLKENSAQLLDPQITKQLIKSRSEPPSQDDIIISVTNTTIKVKLICPLSCRRIETPCRTLECKHIEVFDAHSFLKANDFRYDWLCPICQKRADFDLLRVDGYFTEMLNNTDDSITEVFVKSDATYDVIKVPNSPPVVDLDDTIEDDFDCSVVDADGCIVID